MCPYPLAGGGAKPAPPPVLMSLAVLPTSAKAESGGPSKARAHTPRAEFAPRPRGRVSPQSVSSVVRVCGRGGLLGPPRPCPEGPCPHPAAGAPAPQPALPSRPVGPCPEGTDTKVLSVLLTRLPKIVSLDVGNQYRWRIRYPSKTPGENPLAFSWVLSVVAENVLQSGDNKTKFCKPLTLFNKC